MLASRVQVLSSTGEVLSSTFREPRICHEPAEAREYVGGEVGDRDVQQLGDRTQDLAEGEVAVAGSQYAAEGGVDLDRAPEASLLPQHDVGRVLGAWRAERLLDHVLGQLPGVVEQPVGPALAAHFGAIDASRWADDWLRDHDSPLTEDVIQERLGVPGAEDPTHIVVRQQRGLRRAIEVDTALGGVLGACDGDLTLREILGAVAQLLD